MAPLPSYTPTPSLPSSPLRAQSHTSRDVRPPLPSPIRPQSHNHLPPTQLIFLPITMSLCWSSPCMLFIHYFIFQWFSYLFSLISKSLHTPPSLHQLCQIQWYVIFALHCMQSPGRQNCWLLCFPSLAHCVLCISEAYAIWYVLALAFPLPWPTMAGLTCIGGNKEHELSKVKILELNKSIAVQVESNKFNNVVLILPRSYLSFFCVKLSVILINLLWWNTTTFSPVRLSLIAALW